MFATDGVLDLGLVSIYTAITRGQYIYPSTRCLIRLQSMTQAGVAVNCDNDVNRGRIANDHGSSDIYSR